MPYVVTCPACATRLKTPAVVPAGKAVTCPQCKHAFTTTEVSPELADSVVPRPPVPPPVPRRSKQDDLPAAEFVDDEDEDDRPRAKRRRDDEDEEDDRPRAKRRRDEDDEPAPRRKAKKKKSPLVLILAIGLPLVFLLLVGAGIGAYFMFFSGGASSDMLAWAPSDSTTVRGARLSSLPAGSPLRRNFQGGFGRVESIGISMDNIDEGLIANGSSGDVIVVRLKTATDPAALMRSANATEQTVDGKKFYVGSGAFHLPNSKLLVWCPTDTAMKNLLKKDAKVTIDDDLKRFVGKTSGDVWSARVSKAKGGFGPRGEYGTMRVSGNNVTITTSVVFPDAASAQQAEAGARANAERAKFMGGLGQTSVNVSTSGDTVTVTLSGSLEGNGFIFPGMGL